MYTSRPIRHRRTAAHELARLFVRSGNYRVAYIMHGDCCIAYNYPIGEHYTPIDMDGVFDHHYRADCIKDAAQRIRAAVAATD
jgi:hypothetical protein